MSTWGWEKQGLWGEGGGGWAHAAPSDLYSINKIRSPGDCLFAWVASAQQGILWFSWWCPAPATGSPEGPGFQSPPTLQKPDRWPWPRGGLCWAALRGLVFSGGSGEPAGRWKRSFLLLSFSHSVVSDSLPPHGLQPSRLFCHGILQARILKWVAISFSRGIFPTQVSKPCLLRWQVESLPLSQQGDTFIYCTVISLQISFVES